jgi:light-regulated signal transduction histidine kinase (bacteriophytochrome)
MGNGNRNRTEDEIDGLRAALAAETERCLEIQSRLDLAGAEFEEFVSLAAHDLRESLREVASFSQLMGENYQGRLDPDADIFLNRIREGASRMQSLLADVVDYWTTTSGDRPSSRTDMEAVLHQALLCADKQIRERGAIISHVPLPRVIGDFAILTKVVHHLIRNAIEFCGNPAPRVHISCRREDLAWVFSVQDSGPGIDPAFQARIFGVFKRLHGKEHAGNGLGLAFCRRSVERHGGRMWMESKPDVGSTFYFTLPSAD